MSSKYDVVKVKVHLTEAHHYILSRFSLSKMLMFCCVPEDAAVRISLDVKRHFVNAECTSITQAQLEEYIRYAMVAAGFSQRHTELLPVVSQFHAERIPLVLFIAGPAHCGKTTLAHLLSARLNCSAVVNTEVLRDISASIDECLLVGVAPSSHEDAVVTAVAAEVDKSLSDGRVIIVEGENLSLAYFHPVLNHRVQVAAGAVVLGLVMDAPSTDGVVDVSQTYLAQLKLLQPVLATSRVSVLPAVVGVGGIDGNDGAGAGELATIYVARCSGVGDNVCLSSFLHGIIIQRITAELCRRDKVV